MNLKTLKNKLFPILASATAIFLMGTVSASASNITQFSAACNLNGGRGALSSSVFVPWYKYLPGDNANPSNKCLPELEGKEPATVATLVVMAIIELLTRVAGLVAVGFIIYGSIQYIISQGEPDRINNAKSTITNALIGFVTVVLAITIIQFLGNSLRG